MSAATDSRDALVRRVAADMRSADPTKWAAQWCAQLGADGIPYNAATGTRYRGGNVWRLLAASIEYGGDWSTGGANPRNAWATYRQWSAMGAQVRRGERGTTVVRFGTYRPKGDDGERGKSRAYAKGYAVFNLAQVDVVDVDAYNAATMVPVLANWAPQPAWLDNVPAAYAEGAPAYAPALDMVFLPDRSAFESADAYRKTQAHELGHWTGHASRLNRLQQTSDVAAYAYEELVAELCSVFVCADIGIDPTTRPDHAQYLRGWSDRIVSDPSAFTRAASDASAAFDLLATYRDQNARVAA